MESLRNFFQSLSPITNEAWEDAQKLFKPATLKKEEYFCTEGKVSKDFAFLVSGIVRGFYRTQKGTEYNKHFFTPSSIIGGYTSLITGSPNQVIQQALTDCEILTANYSAFVNLYNAHPCLERAGRLFAERYFVQKEQKELEIIMLDAGQRYKLFKTTYPGLEQLIPQYHIASYLGISATQLSRIRAKLVKQ
ncbi:Crp/Fnr family transcriptional regulator [Mucilaginibacter sp.]|uniref:Crp/Fnr family transcriptional regulator n=1 Tax=Mucilaginibacter sp. TaxID=1882438 RepID=UPI0032669989